MKKKLKQKINSLHIDNVQRHIFLCCDQTEPKCCKKETGLESWVFLKKRLKELGLSESGQVYQE